ncbi:MAG: element excision factor XisI family protein [Nostoc sp.]
MDKLARYREIIRQLIFEYATHKPANGQIEPEAVIDSERDYYEVLHISWDGVRRVHGSVIHIDIINDKVWIQYDGTSQPVAEALLEAGILREDIVLGFHPAELRQYTDFAVS